jgi:EAL domain-containing protein (putative c-di-GMP-specific phosphodiesterase class I)
VRLAVDDFGAGSHALSHPRHLPLDALKLERGFVAAIDDERTAAIVAAVIKLAHELRMDVVAEGVETADQAQALRHSAATWRRAISSRGRSPPVRPARC